jgi:Holliday junction resolvase RusA-like endonuclease
VGQGHSKHVIYSARFVQWEQIALRALANSAMMPKAPLKGHLAVQFNFFFQNHMAEADVSNLIEGPADALKKARVIHDDKQFMRVKAEKFFNERCEPGVEIIICEYVEGVA